MKTFLLSAGLCAIGLGCAAKNAPAQTTAAKGAIKTQVVKVGDKFELMRDGKPYLIKGAGGSGPLKLLHDRGGNSNRTWGSDNIGDQLDEAQKLGMTYTVGIWLGHTEHGFNYSDPKAVADQFERAKAAIDKYKDHPAVLAWGIGNEMEGYGADTDPKMWAAVQQIAAYAHKVDPNHPTMTVIAEIGGDKIPSINKYCPDIDIVGINTYGGGPSIAERYPKAGGVKPYVLTEFGPAGTWEMGKNSWGAPSELSSTDKAKAYAATWNGSIKDKPLALGGYAFTWGFKQEATATWFGMLLPDGEMLGAADAMTELWTGKVPAERVPAINSLKLVTPEKTTPGATVKVALDASDPDKDPIKVKWILQYDPQTESIGGETQATPPTYPEAIVAQSNSEATFKMPQVGGAYRVFAFVTDGKGGAAVANVPLLVEGGAAAPPPALIKAKLPLDLTPEKGDAPFTPSGYMGNAGAIAMDTVETNPHGGKTALRVQYKEANGWGGVVWQSPANDWGEKPGGYDFTGAKTLSFWARGDKGGEVVSFGYGLIGKDQKFFDSGKGELKEVRLTPDWKRYSIDLSGQDLSHIKSGFYWTLGGKDQPITFYLDDIRYESAAPQTMGAANAGTTTPGNAQTNTMNLKNALPLVAGAIALAPVAVKAADAPPKATLPLVVYAEAGDKLTYIPSGYMGDAGNIKMTDDDKTDPHSGKTAIKAQYTAGGGWGGVVWQSPANDWGELPGGLDLTGAKKLTFWARGDKGGEVVSFSYGLLDKAKYADSSKGEIKDEKLTKEWKQYTIDLDGKDLSQIKTPFTWVLGAKGDPITFYLDDIKFE